MYHEDIFCPFLPMFSTFDGKMVNVVENAECFSSCDDGWENYLNFSSPVTTFVPSVTVQRQHGDIGPDIVSKVRVVTCYYGGV